MDEAKVFIMADGALNKVVQQIRDDQWSLPLPEWFQIGRGNRADYNLRKVINYHAYDEAWVPFTLAGQTLAEGEAAGAPGSMDDDLLGDDPKASYQALVDKAIAAARSIEDMSKTVHLSYGDWSASDYLLHITSFRGLRAYDLAKWIGVDTKLPDDLVQGMWDEFSPHFEEWRGLGVFGPEVSVPTNASLHDKLLAASGRDPHA